MKNKRSDIILILCDTLSANRMSLYGYKKNRTTPNLERLCARKEFCLFKNSFTSSPWTIPSHASLFSGLYPSQHKTTGESFETCILRKEVVTFPFLLKLKNYETFGISSNPLVSRDTGFDRGFDYFLNIPKKYSSYTNPLEFHTWVSKKRVLKNLKEDIKNPKFNKRYEVILDSLFALFKFRSSVVQYSYPYTKKTFEIALRILNRVSSPIFLFLNIMENHDKYTPPKRFRNRFKKYSDEEVKRQKWWKHYYKKELSDREKEVLNGLYDEEVAVVDEMLYDFLKKIEKMDKKRFDNSLILILADHGEALGDWNHWGHNFSVYPDTTKVPLIIKFPKGMFTFKEIDQLVLLQDLFAFFLEFVSFDIKSPSGSVSFLSSKRDFALVQNYWGKWNEEFDDLKKDNFMAYILDEKDEFFYLIEEEKKKRIEVYKTHDFINMKKIPSADNIKNLCLDLKNV